MMEGARVSLQTNWPPASELLNFPHTLGAKVGFGPKWLEALVRK